MKKILAILLAITLLSVFSVTVFAEGTATLSATANKTDLSAGDEVSITVSVANAAVCKSMALAFAYDDSTFESVSGAWSLTGTFMADYDSSKKAASVAYTNEANVNGTLFVLKLKVKSDAPTGAATVSVTPVIKNGDTEYACSSASVTLNIQAGDNNNTNADVMAKYNATTPADVCSVDISWGAMEFDYNAGTQTWNTESHTFVDDANAPASWSVNNSSNTITLKNNSSTAVNATFAFTPDSGYTAISGEFTYNAQKLTSALTLAKPTENVEATAYVVSFMPSGTLVSTHSATSYAKIGCITVTLG